MDKKLIWSGLWNSGLLTFTFLSSTVQAAAGGSYLYAAIGAFATYLTAKDSIQFYNAYKTSKES